MFTRKGIGMMLFIFIALSGLLFADPPFELDGNATSGDFLGDEWDVVNFAPGNSVARTGLIIDRPEFAFAQFTGGGSKDQQDIPNWRHRVGTPPAKDDLTNAYAAAYIDPDTTNLIIVFGMDRYDTNGDAQLGFWFLQDDVHPVLGGTWNGVHQDNDILVLVNFSGGGDTPTMQGFRWLNGALVSLGAGTQILCTGGTIPAGQNHCGITNAVNVPAPWTYENKDDGVINFFPPGAFFEGAIDLTALGVGGCFTQFLAESRSSTSITATLKDFATPDNGFTLCGIAATKACSNPRLNAAQDSIIYDISGNISNSGFGNVYDIALSDSPVADGDFQLDEDCDGNTAGTFPFDGPLAGSAQVCYENTITVSLAQNGPTDTVSATANTAPDGSGIEISTSATANCPNLQVSPAIRVTKDCDSSVVVVGGAVTALVTVSGTVCNIGDSNLSNVVVTDNVETTDPNPLVNGISLATPADPLNPEDTPGACVNYSGTYVPSSANDINGDPTTCPGDVVFTDSVTATATDIFGNAVTPHSDSAQCPLCPGSCSGITALVPAPIPPAAPVEKKAKVKKHRRR